MLPSLPAVFVYLCFTFAYLFQIVAKTANHFVYSIDDAYIAMSMARNLIQHGAWSVDNYGFEPSSSTLLWIVVLALTDLLTKSYELCPLVLNVIFSIITILYSNSILERAKLSFIGRLLLLLILVIAIPLPAMTWLGMETVLQVLLTLLFVDRVVLDLAKKSSGINWRICLIGSLLGACRYEGFFTIAPASLIYLLKGRYKQAAALLFFSSLPAVIYGIYASVQGGYFLPNPIILKGHIDVFLPIHPAIEMYGGPFISWFDSFGYQLFTPIFSPALLLISSHLLLEQCPTKGLASKLCGISWILSIANIILWSLLQLPPAQSPSRDVTNMVNLIGIRSAASIALLNLVILTNWIFRKREWSAANIWLIVFIFNLSIHMLLARTGWHFRYESYLIALAVITLAIAQFEYSPKSENSRQSTKIIQLIAKTLVISCISLQLLYRCVGAAQDPVKSAIGLYGQQYQVAQFIRHDFSDSAIMLNDVGAVSFFNDHIKIVDMVGLVTTSVLKVRLLGQFTPQFLDQLAHQEKCKLLVLYESWLNCHGGAPKNWLKVGTWTNKHSQQGDDTVSFYALDAEQATHTAECLRKFELPVFVERKIQSF